jgi:hypothetical protein
MLGLGALLTALCLVPACVAGYKIAALDIPRIRPPAIALIKSHNALTDGSEEIKAFPRGMITLAQPQLPREICQVIPSTTELSVPQCYARVLFQMLREYNYAECNECKSPQSHRLHSFSCRYNSGQINVSNCDKHF